MRFGGNHVQQLDLCQNASNEKRTIKAKCKVERQELGVLYLLRAKAQLQGKLLTRKSNINYVRGVPVRDFQLHKGGSFQKIPSFFNFHDSDISFAHVRSSASLKSNSTAGDSSISSITSKRDTVSSILL